MGGVGQAQPDPDAAFSYHRAIAPMLWVLCGLMLIETAVLHLLVALWSGRAALILSIGGLAALLWFVRFVRSFKHYPVRLTPTDLIWCVGHLRSMTIARTQIAAVTDDWTLADLKVAGVFNGALIAHPNIVLMLDSPVYAGRRTIRYLAHRLDDPAAFVAGLGLPCRSFS